MAASHRELRYTLAPGCQVREEDFGLLFYNARGPRLFFVSSGKLLKENFFTGEHTLETWWQECLAQDPAAKAGLGEMEKTLDHLREKGVILEC
ncbi:MAG: mycofactocin biosynthesis chaperone MftB [Deltaproteobacteria bacterium]|nr:mycofactocin biosynthesis chaperone MftB [Deltaproteobacteria bacterium]